MINICRPILLYNNFVPPVNDRQAWEYEAFGYYDGITVLENLFAEKAVAELDELWYSSVKTTHKLNGGFSSQVLYGFRSEDSTRTIRDQMFWENRENDDYPFLFIVTMRVNGENSKLPRMTHFLETYLSSCLKENGMAITYLTLDNSDLILVLRCKTYLQGAGIVDSFHVEGNDINLEKGNCFRVLYSFSVCGVNKICINSDGYPFADGEQITERVCFRLIEKWPGSITHYSEKFFNQPGIEKENLTRRQILGCEDEVIYLDHVTWKDFLALYKDDTGLLSNSNEDYQKYVLGVTSVLMFKSGTKEKLNLYGESAGQFSHVCEKMGESCCRLRGYCEAFFQKVIEEINGNNSRKKLETYHEQMYYKAIYQIINSLQKYQKSGCIDDTFVLLYHPIRMLIQLINEAKDKELIQDDIYKFFYGINLLTQDTRRMERQFIQNIDLNVRFYEAPAKLSVFYSAYVELIKNMLNEGVEPVHQYEFMLCPGMTRFLRVTRMFAWTSDDKRLMLMEIPERQIYDLKSQMVIIAHETAHFVGRNIRNRAYRYEYIIKSVSRSVSTFLCMDKNLEPFYTSTSAARFEAEYERRLRESLDLRSENAKTLPKRERKPEDRYHTDYAEKDIFYCAQNVLTGQGAELFQTLFNEGQNHRIHSVGMSFKDKMIFLENQEKQFELAQRYFISYMSDSSLLLSLDKNIGNIVTGNIHLFKECFADLMSILILQLKPDEYFRTFTQELAEADIRKIGDFYVLYRLVFVTAVMVKPAVGKDVYIWEIKDMTDILKNEKDTAIAKLTESVLKWIQNYMNLQYTIEDIMKMIREEEEMLHTSKELNVASRFLNPRVNQTFYEYLYQCRQDYFSIHRKDTEKIIKLYKKMKNVKDVENMICTIRETIDEYKQSICSRLDMVW